MAGNQVITFGCRLNAFESEIMQRAAAAAGLDGAVIVNTCAVTAEAERQARQAIRRARRDHPQARIIVSGCAATLAPERWRTMPEIDQVLDNTEKLRPESYRLSLGDPLLEDPLPPTNVENPLPPLGGEGRVRGAAPSPPEIPAPSARPSPPVGERESLEWEEGQVPPRPRAYLQVQQGCDHRCTFCIIPYARGPSRSVPPDAIAHEARRLVAAGCREIVLTGVDLTAYGADLPGRPSLGHMVRGLLAALPELDRLRLSSLDPAEIDPELWGVFAEEPRLMPHLHFSLQSGDDLILKRMKRRHSRADAIAAAKRAHELRPEAALGADLIAGFPTETEDAFRRSLDLVAECGLSFLHVFPYSIRPGTPAARMPQLAGAVIRERAARLRSEGDRALAAGLAGRVGGEAQVLVEREGRGRAECYAEIGFAAPAAIGSIHRMRLVASGARTLVGVPIL